MMEKSGTLDRGGIALGGWGPCPLPLQCDAQWESMPSVVTRKADQEEQKLEHSIQRLEQLTFERSNGAQSPRNLWT